MFIALLFISIITWCCLSSATLFYNNQERPRAERGQPFFYWSLEGKKNVHDGPCLSCCSIWLYGKPPLPSVIPYPLTLRLLVKSANKVSSSLTLWYYTNYGINFKLLLLNGLLNVNERCHVNEMWMGSAILFNSSDLTSVVKVTLMADSS